MLKSLARVTFKALKATIYAPAHFFFSAKTEEEYARAGYLLFGVYLAVALSALYWADPLGAWSWLKEFSASNHESVASFVKGLNQTAGNLVDAMKLPLEMILIAIWCVFLPIKKISRPLGVATAWLTSKLVNWALGLGEAAVARRTASLLALLTLLAIVTFVWTGYYYSHKTRALLEQDYARWLARASVVMGTSALDRPEQAAMEDLYLEWNPEFSQVLGDEHPAEYLARLLGTIYADPLRSERWLTELRAAASGEYRRSRGLWPGSLGGLGKAEAEAWSLYYLFLARAHMRLVLDCEDLQAILIARDLYNRIEYSGLEASKENGLGTVYTCGFSRARQNLPTKGLCEGTQDCLQRALDAYEAAAIGIEDCSFVDKRRRNNRADLVLRLGLSFEALRTELTAEPFSEWLASQGSLRKTIKEHTRDLLACMGVGEKLPTMFLTSAQAYGVIAGLDEEEEERRRALRAAGEFLRMAFVHLPATAPASGFSFYCSALQEGGVLSEWFRNGFVESHLGAPSFPVDALSAKIRMDCGDGNRP